LTGNHDDGDVEGDDVEGGDEDVEGGDEDVEVAELSLDDSYNWSILFSISDKRSSNCFFFSSSLIFFSFSFSPSILDFLVNSTTTNTPATENTKASLMNSAPNLTAAFSSKGLMDFA